MKPNRKTRRQYQQAVDLAAALLAFGVAKRSGIVLGCAEMLEKGERAGVVPRVDFAALAAAGFGVEDAEATSAGDLAGADLAGAESKKRSTARGPRA